MSTCLATALHTQIGRWTTASEVAAEDRKATDQHDSSGSPFSSISSVSARFISNSEPPSTAASAIRLSSLCEADKARVGRLLVTVAQLQRRQQETQDVEEGERLRWQAEREQLDRQLSHSMAVLRQYQQRLAVLEQQAVHDDSRRRQLTLTLQQHSMGVGSSTQISEQQMSAQAKSSTVDELQRKVAAQQASITERVDALMQQNTEHDGRAATVDATQLPSPHEHPHTAAGDITAFCLRATQRSHRQNDGSDAVVEHSGHTATVVTNTASAQPSMPSRTRAKPTAASNRRMQQPTAQLSRSLSLDSSTSSLPPPASSTPSPAAVSLANNTHRSPVTVFVRYVGSGWRAQSSAYNHTATANPSPLSHCQQPSPHLISIEHSAASTKAAKQYNGVINHTTGRAAAQQPRNAAPAADGLTEGRGAREFDSSDDDDEGLMSRSMSPVSRRIERLISIQRGRTNSTSDRSTTRLGRAVQPHSHSQPLLGRSQRQELKLELDTEELLHALNTHSTHTAARSSNPSVSAAAHSNRSSQLSRFDNTLIDVISAVDTWR